MSTTAQDRSLPLPTFSDVEAAIRRIAGHCIETPLLESPLLNRRLGGRLLLKAENLQITGSFKLRGAVNRLAMLTDEERRRGVVARSSGNHGLAVASCCDAMGTTAVIVAPNSAPRAKVDRIRAYGARVVQAPMHAIAAVAVDLAEREGRVPVPPADDPRIVAGAGTVAIEIVAQASRMGAILDALLVCCSGGGLTAGCVLALDTLAPDIAVYGVEPAGFEKMSKSLAAGRRIDNPAGGSTICDALSGPYTAAIPFEIVKPRLTGTLAVTDDEVKHAMRAAFGEFGLAIEPGAAVALAAVLSGRFPIVGRTVAVTISGRNVDLDLAARILGETAATVDTCGGAQ